MKQRHVQLAILFLLLLSLSGCSVSRHATKPRNDHEPVAQTIIVPKTLPTPAQALLSQARSWLGTPYRYGGNDHDGIDCSGLVTNVYRDALKIKLPRNSREQSDYCTPVKRDKMVAGDLVFFATGEDSTKVSHVGMYIGEGKMIHASGTKGVVIVELKSDYFAQHFAGAGKVEQYHALMGKKDEIFPEKEEDLLAHHTNITYTKTERLPEKRAGENQPTSQLTLRDVPNLPSHITPIDNEPRERVLNALIEQKLDSIIASGI